MAITTMGVLAATAIAAAVASTTTSIVNSRKSSKAAKAAAADQDARSKALEGQLAAKSGAVGPDKLAARNAARQRQRSLARGASGRKDTVLTSPLGDVGGDAGSEKTLLGT